jgi:hypothetical protein
MFWIGIGGSSAGRLRRWRKTAPGTYSAGRPIQQLKRHVIHQRFHHSIPTNLENHDGNNSANVAVMASPLARFDSRHRLQTVDPAAQATHHPSNDLGIAASSRCASCTQDSQGPRRLARLARWMGPRRRVVNLRHSETFRQDTYTARTLQFGCSHSRTTFRSFSK